MAESGSLNNLANAMNNLNSTYDAAATPGTNDTMGDIADYSGLGTPFPSNTLTNDGSDLALWGNFAVWSTGSNFSGSRRMRDIGDGGQNYPCNQYVICGGSADYRVEALVSDCKVYRNGTLQTTLTNAGDTAGVGAFDGDIIGFTRPANIAHGTQEDMGCAYMGWSGFVFCHARDRNTGATLSIVSLTDDTDWEVRYSTTTGNITSTTAQTSGTITSAYGRATVTLTSTRYYIIYANKPVACYVRLASGAGVNDTLPLYPMDQDSKFGAFSTGGHLFILNNASQGRAAVNVTQQLFNYSSDSTNTTEKNASSAYNNWYIDISPGETSAALFAGPVQKIDGGNGVLIGAEQQGDSNGSEMTPFVSRKAFGKSAAINWGPTDWVTCIGESAMTITHRRSNGAFVASQSMAGSGLYGLYFARFTSTINNGDIFTSNSDFILYFDSLNTNDDERVQIMGESEFSASVEETDISGPFGDSEDACNTGPGSTAFTAYFLSSYQVGAEVYTDSNYSTTLKTTAGSGWYYNFTTADSFEYDVSTALQINQITACP
jgi:hypothetical protein